MQRDFSRGASRLVRRIPILLLLPIVGAGVWVTVAPPYTNSPPIRSDGLGYYAWTDALLDGDFDFCQWPEMATVGALTGRDPAHPNRCSNRYSAAMALLRLPVMGPIALLSGHGNAKKLVVSNANEEANQWLGIATLLLTALLMWGALRRLDVGTWTAQLTVLCLVFGAGLFDYATYDSAFTHDTSAALFAALIFAGVGAMRRRARPNSWLVFALSLFIAWIREPDIAPLLLLVGAWTLWQTQGLAGARRLRAAVRLAAPAIGGVILALFIQLLYVRWSTNTWTLNTYGASASFNLRDLEEWNVLFSYNHGLFLWFPVLALMIAIALWQRKSRNWGWLALASVASLTVIYGSWTSWFLGGADGQRGFIDIVPIISAAGGLGLAQLRGPRRGVALAAAVLLSWLTVELMAGYWSGVLPFEYDTATQFWQQVAGSHALLND